MAIKKKNHTVSKTLLKRWKDSNTDKLWVLDIQKQTIEPRSLDSTFAIEYCLYVPKINNNRNDNIERWFEGGENELGRYLDEIENALKEQRGLSKKFAESLKYHLLKLGIVSMAYRNSHHIENSIKLIQNDPKLAQDLGVPLDTYDEIHRLAVENMMNRIVLADRSFLLPSIKLLHGFNQNLMISDVPAIDLNSSMKALFLPVGPQNLLCLDDGDRGGYTIQKSNDSTIVSTLNELAVQNARKWIVASSKEELEAVFDQVTIEKVEARISKEKVFFKGFDEETRRSLYSLPDN